MKLSLRLASVLPCIFVTVLLCGCSGSDADRVPVNGKLVVDGQPFNAQLTGPKFPTGEGVGMASVVLYPVKDDKEPLLDDNGDPKIPGAYSAQVEADGSFTASDHTGKGIPPGKYRFVVKQIDPTNEKDRLGNRFDEKNSKLTQDVVAGKEIVLDLGKPKK